MNAHRPSRLESFADATTIHGIKDFLTCKQKVLKVIWGFFLLGAVGLMCEEIYRACKNFDSAPTTIDLQVVDIDMYPTVHICTQEGYDEWQARWQFNFTDEDMAYINLIFGRLYKEDDMLYSYQVSLMNSPTENEERKAVIQQKMKQNNLTTVEDMINIISGDQLVDRRTEFPVIRKRWAPNAVFFDPHGGVCYTISNVSLNSEMKFYLQDGARSGVVVVGEDPFGQRYVFDGNVTTYTFYIWEISKVSLLNKRQSYCKEAYSSHEQCMQDCMIQLELCNCSGTDGGASYLNNESFWQIVGGCNLAPENLQFEQLNPDCYKDYLVCSQCKPCTIWNYQFSVFLNDFDPSTNGRMFPGVEPIGLTFKSVKLMKLSTEYYTYPAVSLLSNIGGLISLFCGASVLSLVQLGMYWGGKACDKKRETAAVDEEVKQEAEFHKWLQHTALHMPHCKLCMKFMAKTKQ